MEGSDLSIRLNLEPTAAVEATPVVQGQAAPKDGEGKSRRRPPPEKQASGELEQPEDELEKPEDEAPQHRIDSLA